MRNDISWEGDYERRVNPALLTDLVQDAVPSLKHVNWTVQETDEGYCRTVVPLTRAAANHNGSHFAGVMTMAADATGSIALITLLRGEPVLGVHPRSTDEGAACWTVKMEVRYAKPSTSDLVISARIPAERFETIRRRYSAGQVTLEHVEVQFESDGDVVATAVCSYFLRQARYLKPQTPDAPASVLFDHRAKTSARLIAGLRATENGVSDGQFRDPYSPVAAGAHGRLLAEKFAEVLPPLRDMVVARTRHIDDLITKSLATGRARQVVLIGAGLDFRMYRLPINCEEVVVYEVDLPPMLTERQKVLSRLGTQPPPQWKAVPINLELQDVAQVLLGAGFDPARPAIFILEGVSMYLSEETNAALFGCLASLMGHPDSVVWVDVVAKSVVERRAGFPEVDRFLSGMERLGEPFVFGLDDPRPFFGQLGYRVGDQQPSNCYRPDYTNPIFGLYSFCLLNRASA